MSNGIDVKFSAINGKVTATYLTNKPDWRDKANETIEKLAREAFKQANYYPSGKKRKRYVPYSLPEEASMLVKCLAEDDEEAAKAYFIKCATYGRVVTDQPVTNLQKHTGNCFTIGGSNERRK